MANLSLKIDFPPKRATGAGRKKAKRRITFNLRNKLLKEYTDFRYKLN